MSRPTDHDLDLSVAGMLRFGVTLAALVVFIGGVMYLHQPLATIPSYTHFHAESTSLRTATGVVHGVMHADPASIIQFGLILLIATPVARVVFCVVGFARQRSTLYFVISSLVLLILIYSLTSVGR